MYSNLAVHPEFWKAHAIRADRELCVVVAVSDRIIVASRCRSGLLPVPKTPS
jgi:hypothetical protein